MRNDRESILEEILEIIDEEIEASSINPENKGEVWEYMVGKTNKKRKRRLKIIRKELKEIIKEQSTTKG